MNSGWVFQAHPNVVQLRTSAAIVHKIGYTLANPVGRALFATFIARTK